MFVQIINGRVKDADELRRHGERWRKDVMPGAKEQCLRVGMDDYLPKPVKFEDLKAVLDRTLSR